MPQLNEMEEPKRRDSETEEEYENRITEYRREMKIEEEGGEDGRQVVVELPEESSPSQSSSSKEIKPEVDRKRSFSDRQRILEEKKIQQQREEAERSRIEDEKRMKRDAKRRERKELERREALRLQKLEEQQQAKANFDSYYGPNFSVHPALSNRVPSKPPPPVIRQEYDAFSDGMTPERIIGATDELGELSFLVKWKGTDEADFVPAKKAKLHCPELVIRFFEGIIAWK